MFLFPLIGISPQNSKSHRHIMPEKLTKIHKFPNIYFAGVPIDDMYPHLEIEDWLSA